MKKIKIICAIYLLFILCFLIFSTSPSVNSGDSGEFITTSCILGIAHSPGYPLYSLLGKMFSIMIPFGNYAYRINLMNTIFVLISIIFVILWSINVYNEKIKILILLCFLGVLIFSEAYLKNTIQTEVFILNSLFSIVLIISSYYAKKQQNLWYLISFISGLSLGNHHTIVFLFPGIFYLFVSYKNLDLKKIFLCIFFFFLGFSCYIMLPIRSQKNPYFDWGDTEKLANLYNVITRKDYGTFQLTVEKKLDRSFNNFYLQIKRFFKESLKNLTPIGLFFVFLSFIILFFNNKKFFIFLFSSYILSGLGFLVLANLPLEPIHNGILERFYILPNTIAIMSILVSLIYINRFLFLIFILTVISFGYNFLKNIDMSNYRNYFLNYDYGMNILKTLPYNSILFMDGGDDTFYTLGYLQAVEKRRRDLELHDRGGLVFKNIYGVDFRKLSKQEKELRRINIEKNFIPIRPVFYSTFNKNILPNETLKYAGVLYFVESSMPDEEYSQDLIFDIYSYRSVYQKYFDYRSNALAPVYYFMEAVNENEPYKKFLLLKYSYFLWPEVDWLKNNIKFELHNLGYQMFNEKKYEFCKNIYKLLLSIDNTDINALLNLGVVYEKLNDFSLAENCYNKVLEIDINNATAYYNLAVLYWNKNDWDKVIFYFNKVLEIQPENQVVKNYLYRAIVEKNRKK